MKKLYLSLIAFLFTTSTLFGHANFDDFHLKNQNFHSVKVDSIPFSERNMMFFLSYGTQWAGQGNVIEVSGGLLFNDDRIFMGAGFGYNSFESFEDADNAVFLPVFLSSKIVIGRTNFITSRNFRRRGRQINSPTMLYFTLDAGGSFLLNEDPKFQKGGWMANAGFGSKTKFGGLVNLFIEITGRARNFEFFEVNNPTPKRETTIHVFYQLGLSLAIFSMN
jgi:hypothetical protein